MEPTSRRVITVAGRSPLKEDIEEGIETHQVPQPGSMGATDTAYGDINKGRGCELCETVLLTEHFQRRRKRVSDPGARTRVMPTVTALDLQDLDSLQPGISQPQPPL